MLVKVGVTLPDGGLLKGGFVPAATEEELREKTRLKPKALASAKEDRRGACEDFFMK